jgi:hypothetical protein
MPLPTKNSFDDIYGYQPTRKWAKMMCKQWDKTCDTFKWNGMRKQLANIVTTGNLVVTGLVFACLYLGSKRHPIYYVVGIVLLTVRQYLDMLDGSIARVCDMKSQFGNIYDHVADAVFMLGMLGLFVYLVPPHARMWVGGFATFGMLLFLSDIIGIIDGCEDDSIMSDTINDHLILVNVGFYVVLVAVIELTKGKTN